MRLLLPLLALLATPACAMVPQGEMTQQVPVTYRCDGGVSVPVIFVNPPQSGIGYAAAVIEGKLMVLQQAVSASGARYRADQPAPGYQIWVKGDDAMITTGPENADRPIAENCSAAD